jgi:hypothetical protein
LCVGSIACGSRPLPMSMRAPNPNGCYVMVFEEPAFKSSSDVSMVLVDGHG